MEALTSAPHGVYQVHINGRNVTADLTPFILSVTYTDYVEGEADTVDVRLEDTDGRFRGAWYPTKGDAVMLKFGFVGERLTDAGRFEIDEIELEGPPDVVVIKAIAAGVKTPHRTRQGRAYEEVTLAAIAQRVAKRLKLQLVGTIEPIAIRRVTQIHENDLTFLRRVAGEYGYAFNVKGSKMVFFKRAELRSAQAVLSIDRLDLTRYHLRDKIMGVVSETKVAYHDAKTKRLRHYRVQDTTRATSADHLKLNIRAESPAQAKVKAEAALEAANSEATVLEGDLYGQPRLLAGINFELTSMGILSGIYHTVMSRHTIERGGGYNTAFESKRVREANKAKAQAKPKENK